jgi:hypothetical protein
MLLELERSRAEWTRLLRELSANKMARRRTKGRPDGRFCSRCAEFLPADSFYRSGTLASGKPKLRSQCKACSNSYRTAFRKQKVEQHKAYDRAYAKARWQKIKSDPVLMERKREQQRAYNRRRAA